MISKKHLHGLPSTRRGYSWDSLKILVRTLTLFSLISQCMPLKCFHCLERPRSTEKHLSCAFFDMSSKFHKECTHSTFCMKRTSNFQLHNGTYITIYVHKCADQSHRTMVQDKNGDWNWANLLRLDLYNEGCVQHHSPSRLTTEASHCFCSSDLCNHSSSKNPSSLVIFISAFSVIAFLNIY